MSLTPALQLATRDPDREWGLLLGRSDAAAAQRPNDAECPPGNVHDRNPPARVPQTMLYTPAASAVSLLRYKKQPHWNVLQSGCARRVCALLMRGQ